MFKANNQISLDPGVSNFQSLEDSGVLQSDSPRDNVSWTSKYNNHPKAMKSLNFAHFDYCSGPRMCKVSYYEPCCIPKFVVLNYRLPAGSS